MTYGIGREPALAVDYDGGIKYYICDHLGSVRTVFDENGKVLSDHEYEPFDNEFFDTKEDNRLSWIGKERDRESLLGDFGARKYDFLSGRFTSIDPLWEQYYEWTPYQYSFNNPVSLIDFSGLAVAGQINWSSSSIGYAFSMEAQDEKREKVQNDDNEKTAIENTNENTQDGEYTFWNYLYFAQYYIPIWGSCKLASDCINRGAYGEAFVHWLTGLAEAILITHGYYSSAGSATGISIGKGIASGKGFSSYYAFKKAMGPAGKGMAWHHIVEQNPANIARFGPEAIHNTSNIIKLPNGAGSIHAKISGYYSSKQFFTNGLTVRKWLSTQSFEQQCKFGIETLKKFGWKQ